MLYHATILDTIGTTSTFYEIEEQKETINEETKTKKMNQKRKRTNEKKKTKNDQCGTLPPGRDVANITQNIR